MYVQKCPSNTRIPNILAEAQHPRHRRHLVDDVYVLYHCHVLGLLPEKSQRYQATNFRFSMDPTGLRWLIWWFPNIGVPLNHPF